MGFDDRWFDVKAELQSAMDDLPDWLDERERQAFRDAVVVVAYLSRYVDIAGMPPGTTTEANPILAIFPGVAERLLEIASEIRERKLLEWKARKHTLL